MSELAPQRQASAAFWRFEPSLTTSHGQFVTKPLTWDQATGRDCVVTVSAPESQQMSLTRLTASVLPDMESAEIAEWAALAALREGWDGFRARAPRTRAVQLAKTLGLMLSCESEFITKRQIVPDVDGGLVVHLFCGCSRVDCFCDNDGDLTVLFVSDDETSSAAEYGRDVARGVEDIRCFLRDDANAG